jgi:hypothetical protein
VQVNENFQTLEHQQVYGRRQPASSGLSWGYYGGRWGGIAIADGTLTLTNGATNYVVVAIATGAITVDTSPTNWNDATNFVHVYLITTALGVVATVEDHRVGARGVLGASASGGGGGGLTQFSEAISTLSPNNTVNVGSLTLTGGSTNGDAAIVPRGDGALLARVPDGTFLGGNKRGLRAIDFGLTRTLAARVAAGADSIVIGNDSQAVAQFGVAVGYNVRVSNATASYSFGKDMDVSASGACAIGAGSTVSGNDSSSLSQSSTISGARAVGVGRNLTAAGTDSIAIGSTATAGGASSVAVGFNAAASGDRSVALGEGAWTRSASSRFALSLARRATAIGSLQHGIIHLYLQTTGATASRLCSDGSASASPFNQLLVSPDQVHLVRGRVTAIQASTNDVKVWSFEAILKRSTAGNVVLVAAVSPTVTFADAGAAAWTIAVSADTSNQCLNVTATGEASKTINWLCELETLENT